jgi:hypothetical protein
MPSLLASVSSINPCRQCGFDPNWENTENLAQHARNIQERETQKVDDKEVSISEKLVLLSVIGTSTCSLVFSPSNRLTSTSYMMVS